MKNSKILKPALIVCGVLVGVGVLTLCLHHSAPTVTAPVATAPSSINTFGDMQLKLAKIESSLDQIANTQNDAKASLVGMIDPLAQQIQDNAKSNQAALDGIHAELADLSRSLAQTSEHLNQTLDQAMSVNSGNACLPSKMLPFVLQSIDLINGTPVLSASFNNQIVPLETGFALAGWTLQSVSYHRQMFEFINTKKVCASGKLAGDKYAL